MQRIVIASLLFIGMAVSHTTMAYLSIAGKEYDQVTGCIRGYDYQTPIQYLPDVPNGILGENYTCGWQPYASKYHPGPSCTIAAGDRMGVKWFHGGNGYPGETPELDNWIAVGHRGPIMIFLGKMNDIDDVSGVKWFKIYQESIIHYDAQDFEKTEWASAALLNKQNGYVWFNIPEDLAPGDYFLRSELIALHAAREKSGAQPCVRCADLRIIGKGTVTAEQIDAAGYSTLIPSPEYATLEHPGMIYDLYTAPNVYPYPYPGKNVYTAGGIINPSPTTPPVPTPQPPAPAPTTNSVIEFRWASSSKRKTGSCIAITQPNEPSEHTWSDNYLCALNEDISAWIWSTDGLPDNEYVKCVQWLETQDKDGWSNSSLCIPLTDSRKYAFSAAGTIPGMTCTRLLERKDPDGWGDNFWCTSASSDSIVNVGYNGVYNSSEGNQSNDYQFESEDSGSMQLIASITFMVIIALLY